MSAASKDGKAHSVQVYTDISAEWVSGDNSLVANWSTTTGNVLTHQVQLQNPSVYAEINDHIQRMETSNVHDFVTDKPFYRWIRVLFHA